MSMNSMRKCMMVGVILTSLGAIPAGAQPMARFSLDFRTGMPTILTEANPAAAPFGGIGLRYSFNEFISVGLNANGGTMAGRTVKNGFFRNNFIMGGGAAYLNTTAFFKKRTDSWKRFNLYVGAGASQMMYYYTLGNLSNDNKLSRTHFLYETGLTARYYINEMLDLTAGYNFYFSQTTKLDNITGDGNYDHFSLASLGLSIKFLPFERKQHVDWQHIALPYNTGTMALTKDLVKGLEKELKDSEKKENDSLSKVLRKEIQVVDEKVVKVNSKVDSLDAKLNKVLDILNQMNTQGVNVNNQQPANNTQQPNVPVPVKDNKAGKGSGQTKQQPPAKGSGANGKDKTQTGGTTQPNSSTTGTPANDTKVTPEPKQNLTYTTQTGDKVKAATIDASQVKENYAIVVGSFVQDQNAINAREKYISKGWDAHILGNAKSPYKRIVIFSNNYFEAAKIVTELRQTDQPDVWMLDINTGKGVFIK